MPVTEIKIKPPFNHQLSLLICRRSKFEVIDEATPHTLKRVISVNDIPVMAAVEFEGTPDRPRCHLEWNILGNGRLVETEIVSAVKKYISADLDLAPFYKKGRRTKRFAALVDRLYGLKPILTPSPFEAGAWSIIGQQINLNFAFTIKKRLVEKYGTLYRNNGTALYSFPEPRTLSRVKKASLLKMQFSERKAEYLIGFSRNIIEKERFFDILESASYDDAVNDLMAIRGIGIWSANYILMRGIGHTDCLPLGDSGLNRAVRLFYRLKQNPDNETVLKYARSFSPYRSLYTLYLWFYLMEGLSE